MKKILNILMCFSILASQQSFAECDFSKDIQKTEKGYLYTNECHGRVGVLVKDNLDKDSEIKDLRLSIDYKDQALAKADERIMLWRNESYNQFDRLQTQYQYSDKQKWLWFALGIVVTSAAVYGAGQLK